MADDDNFADKKKTHKKKHSGVKADKKKLSKEKKQNVNPTNKPKNPKAFAISAARSAEKRFRRKEDLITKKQHIPLVDKTPDEPPPIIVAVVGPPKVGKTTLINNLIKNFTRTNVTSINGPITLVTSKKRRLTLIECNNDINSMIDIAKTADLVLLLCDASFGFEMEIFEFLNICQVHGMPKIMGILTHLDMIRNVEILKRKKKLLKHRFWTEVHQGAKLFYLSGIIHGEYMRNEIKNLGRFISVMKFRPLTWRGAHSYVLGDRMEDITNSEEVRLNPKCDRNIVLYGYVRGVPMQKDQMVHIAGLGDIKLAEINALSDPCPLPSAEKKRNLLEKERLLYAPMSGVGGIVYDKDAVYIELQGSHSHNQGAANREQDEMVNAFIDKKETFDVQIENQEFKLFSDGDVIKSSDFQMDDAEEEQSEDEDSGLEDDDGGEQFKADWEDDEEEEQQRVVAGDENSDSSDEEYQNMGDADEEPTHSWKEGLAQKARSAYLERQANTQSLMKLVYGSFSTKAKQEDEAPAQDDDDEMIGGLFQRASKAQNELQKEKSVQDNEECCFFETYADGIRDWMAAENKALIRDCFVTGKWRASEDATELLKLDDLSDAESEVYGDFEDLETGKQFKSKQTEAEEDDESEAEEEEPKSQGQQPDRKRKITRIESDNMTRKELMAKKMKLKAKFDAEYDEPSGASGEKSHQITGDHDFYEHLKAEASRQSDLNKKEFSNLEDDVRLQIEGYRAGLYVRMNFHNVPCEFVHNFDPTYPILVGGLNMAEENLGYVSCKVKKHRWYKKILKTSDPLIISLGWRRFQTMPIFAKIEDDLKHRYLKYTPNHVTCNMTFYGPITPQNTGFLAVQTVSNDTEEMRKLGFRIAATGAVNEVDKSSQILKKLKLVGTPFKIYKKSAFIQGMFTTALEVAKFEGAKIKTVSGIRGQIKKAHHSPEGSFRATFEDKIMISDIVFCRTWYKVDVQKFYAPVTNMLLSPDMKSQWQGMKTLGQLKRENNIQNQPQLDSMYQEIKREEKPLRPLTIPKNLQKSLPYKDKPKQGPKDPRKPIDAGRVAVIHSPHEQKIAQMMKMIKTNYQYKQTKQKDLSRNKQVNYRKEKEKEEYKKMQRQKDVKKRVLKTLSKIEQSKKTKEAKSHR